MRNQVAAIMSALLIVTADPAVAQGGPAGVGTDFVATREVSETVTVFGQIVAGRQSDVAARVMGVAENSPLRVGDEVTKGSVIFQIDTERLQIELEQARAEISIAEAGIAVAQARADRTKKVLERTETLLANSAVSQAQLDDRSSEYAEALGSLQQAQARMSAARSGLNLAAYNMENSIVRAPFDGIVLEVSAEVGEYVSAGHVVVRLLDSGALEVEANVPSRFIGALQSGRSVMARTDTGSEVPVTLRSILPTEFASTRTRPVRFSLTERNADIAVGQTVTLDVPVSLPEEVVAVPKDAVVQAQGGWRVFVNDGGKAQPRQVEIGRSIGNMFEVVSGLEVGDEVVVRGNERLRPGQEIMPTPQGTGGEERPATEAKAPNPTNGG